ncbi:TetR/AcrR family transcriptional regulator [Skermania piniformis]|uniref:TetR/AcrR family transcriptional regulator n=1 Tax=Skermania pinensis TaxID=39122 RepID=A0ABX8SB74_9ACTN|nr:TetR/AcrR family transcriptional regulator [Skermania piniformis]QXQ13695.1 TetR/AcrR family transcriptional regulator [Skermania piniformis]
MRPINARDRLVAAGRRLLETEGAEALQARRIATEAGLSTMALYTHFDGLPGLLDALIDESYQRFAATLAGAPRTGDPLTDLFTLGLTYRAFALDSPQRYRLMLGLTNNRPGPCEPIDRAATGPPPAADDAAFGELVRAVEAVIGTGQVRADPAVAVAGRLWTVVHGAVLLELAGFFGPDEATALGNLAAIQVDLLVGMGAERDRAVSAQLRAHTDRPIEPAGKRIL